MDARKAEDVKAGLTRLGFGFIRKLRAVRKELAEMAKIAGKHGVCCPPCEIPKMARDFEGMVEDCDWYLNALVEAEEHATRLSNSR